MIASAHVVVCWHTTSTVPYIWESLYSFAYRGFSMLCVDDPVNAPDSLPIVFDAPMWTPHVAPVRFYCSAETRRKMMAFERGSNVRR